MSLLNEKQVENLRRNNKVKFERLANPCVDCNLLWHPLVMSFDHTDRNLKKSEISALLIREPKDFDEELAKCEVVCLNCHQIREYVRDILILNASNDSLKKEQLKLYEQLIEFLSGGALLRKDTYDHVEIGVR
jgi:hypothetical protein